MRPTVGYKNRESQGGNDDAKEREAVCIARGCGGRAECECRVGGDAGGGCGDGLQKPRWRRRCREDRFRDIAGAVATGCRRRGPTPSGRITPANPGFCKVLGHIDPTDPKAPPIKFQVNLPVEWNGRSVQYGGGGFNGVLITGLGLPPAYPFDKPSPLARGFVTYGTDSGH